jgi:hypothetical protein
MGSFFIIIMLSLRLSVIIFYENNCVGRPWHFRAESKGHVQRVLRQCGVEYCYGSWDFREGHRVPVLIALRPARLFFRSILSLWPYARYAR